LGILKGSGRTLPLQAINKRNKNTPSACSGDFYSAQAFIQPLTFAEFCGMISALVYLEEQHENTIFSQSNGLYAYW